MVDTWLVFTAVARGAVTCVNCLITVTHIGAPTVVATVMKTTAAPRSRTTAVTDSRTILTGCIRSCNFFNYQLYVTVIPQDLYQ